MTLFVCSVCNKTANVGVAGSFYCINCNEMIGGYFHKSCLVIRQLQCIDCNDCIVDNSGMFLCDFHPLCNPQMQCKDCRDCTSDKSRMYVSIFHKVQYIGRHYVTSKEEYDELINEFIQHNPYVNKSQFDFNKIFMDNFITQSSYNDYYWKILYEQLLKKYEVTNESIEETIKDQWYRSRSGCLTKRAIKE